MVTGTGVHGNVLETVRLARGVTQSDLAALSGLSQATISKAESGTARLPADHVEQIAQALRVPPELLAGDQLPLASPTSCIFHRKRASTTIGQAKQARAKLALARLHSEALLSLIGGAETVLPRTSPTTDGYITPEDVAREVRATLSVPSGPLVNLVEMLEQAGAVVMAVDLGGPRLDALSDWRAGRRPVLLVNHAAPGERQRFTLAHETGHAVMHRLPAEGLEDQADRFAAELLMPAADIRHELQNPTLERLLALKKRWKVSAAALARRAYDLGVIGDYPYRRLNTEMSASGWRAAEPIPLAAERPSALADALRQARQRLDDRSIAARLYLLPDHLDMMFDDRRTA